MAQLAKYIDITRTYLPVEPEAFTQSEHDTKGEDTPEQRIPVMAYEGYNFMPTQAGYRSFFGMNSKLDISAIAVDVDHVLVIQKDDYTNFLVALASDGIYTKVGETDGAWVHAVTLTANTEAANNPWSYCVIGNTIFMYRKGGSYVYKIDKDPVNFDANATTAVFSSAVEAAGGNIDAGTYNFKIATINSDGVVGTASADYPVITTGTDKKITLNWSAVTGISAFRIYYMQSGTNAYYFDVGAVTTYLMGSLAGINRTYPPDLTEVETPAYGIQSLVPTTLTMSGQVGIFRAGGRLGFWDTDGAVAWSSYTDKTDFTPSITTQANVATFTRVSGNITTIKGQGDGFVIYASKSIVQVVRDQGQVFGWKDNVLSTLAGVAYAGQVAVSNPDNTHFAWTTNGLVRISNGDIEIITPEVYDYLKSSLDPIFLQVLEGRYLFLQTTDRDLLYGRVQQETVTVKPPKITLTSLGTLAAVPLLGDGATKPGYIRAFLNALTNDTNQMTYMFAGVDTLIDGENYPLYGSGYLTRLNPTSSGRFAFDVSPTSAITWTATNSIFVGPDDAALAAKPNSGVTVIGDINTTTVSHSVNTYYATAMAGSDQVGDGVASALIEGPDSFINAIIIWQRELKWARDRANAIKNKVEGYGTLAAAVTPTYNSATGVFTYVGSNSHVPSGTVLPMAKVTTQLLQLDIPWQLGTEHYGLYETIYMLHQSIIGVMEYTFFKEVWTDTPEITGYRVSGYGAGTYTTQLAAINAAKAAWNAAFSHDHIWKTNEASGIIILIDNYGYWDTFPTQYAVATITPVFGTFNIYERFYVRRRYKELPECEAVLACYITATEYADWDATAGEFVPTAGTPQTLSDVSPFCVVADSGNNTMGGVAVNRFYTDTGNMSGADASVGTYTYDPDLLVEDVDFPTGSYSLITGSPTPFYPTFVGALVYDTFYKKWGKMKADHKILANLAPINTETSSPIPYIAFGVQGALLKEDGFIYSFDANPSDAYIKYGKIGLFRLGMTTLQEVILQFHLLSTGTVKVETSLDGKTVEASLTKQEDFTDVRNITFKTGSTGRWHNLIISGQFDLTYIQVVAYRSGRR